MYPLCPLRFVFINAEAAENSQHAEFAEKTFDKYRKFPVSLRINLVF
jgi:hypothetical protein